MSNRYLEENFHNDERAAFAQVWSGVEEQENGLGVQRERLELRPDGTFTHALVRELLLAQDGDQPGQRDSRCSGSWQLFNIRHLGADVDAAADKEIGFTRGDQSPPLLAKRLIVCGLNPHVNGFVGSACRLYPESRKLPGGSGAESAVEEEEVDEEFGEDAEYEPSEEEVKQLQEATGCAADACLAALCAFGGRLEDAAEHLFVQLEAADEASGSASSSSARPSSADGAATEAPEGRPPSGDASGGAPTVSATMAEVMALETEEGGHAEALRQSEDALRQLVEVTGCSEKQCRRALEAHGWRPDAAAEQLLNLPEGGDGSSEDAGDAADGSEADGASSADAGGGAAQTSASEGGATEGVRQTAAPAAARPAIDLDEGEPDEESALTALGPVGASGGAAGDEGDHHRGALKARGPCEDGGAAARVASGPRAVAQAGLPAAPPVPRAALDLDGDDDDDREFELRDPAEGSTVHAGAGEPADAGPTGAADADLEAASGGSDAAGDLEDGELEGAGQDHFVGLTFAAMQTATCREDLDSDDRLALKGESDDEGGTKVALPAAKRIRLSDCEAI